MQENFKADLVTFGFSNILKISQFQHETFLSLRGQQCWEAGVHRFESRTRLICFLL